MECYKCSNDKKIVKMHICFNEKIGAEIAKCPECGREEIIGFGKIA